MEYDAPEVGQKIGDDIIIGVITERSSCKQQGGTHAREAKFNREL